MQRLDTRAERRKKDAALAQVDDATTRFSDAHKRRRAAYPRSWYGPNLLRMADAGEPQHEWGRYLRRMIRERELTVAKLAELAGMARQTIFEYIRDGGESVTVGSVRRIARALDDDFRNALLAAGNIPLAAIDDEARMILDDPILPDEVKMELIQELEAERQTDQRLLDEMARRDRNRRVERLHVRVAQAQARHVD